MATCLRCDGCGDIISEQDRGLDAWWRLERYGQDWIDEPRRVSKPALAEMMPTIELVDGYDVVGDGPEMDSFDDDFLPTVTLHFCKTKCLALWATQAEEFEMPTLED